MGVHMFSRGQTQGDNSRADSPTNLTIPERGRLRRLDFCPLRQSHFGALVSSYQGGEKRGRTWMNLIRIFCPLRIKSDNGISFCEGRTVREKDWTVCLSKWHFSMSFMHLLKGQYLITGKILRLKGFRNKLISRCHLGAPWHEVLGI